MREKQILEYLERIIKARVTLASELQKEICTEAGLARGFCPNVVEDRVLKLQKNDAALTALRGVKNWILDNS